MADNTVNNVADSVENTARSGWQTIKNTFNGAVRIAKPALLIGAGVAALSFAMDPTLLSSIASDMATQEAATSLTGAVGQSIGNVATYLGTGVANSGPVWSAGWEGLSSAGGSIADWWGATDFTPT